MKIILSLLIGLLLISPCFAGDKVYTDEDLGKYKIEQSSKSYIEDRNMEIDKRINNSERIMDLMNQGKKIISDPYLEKYQKCRQIRAINEEAETLGADTTYLKLSMQEYCGTLY
jgi:hypothetical protein